MRFFCFILLVCGFSVNAQVCSGPGATAQTAQAVCATQNFQQQFIPPCTGVILPMIMGNSCGAADNLIPTDNSAWYKIHVYQSGTLGFTIQPTNPGADYDWVLFNITNQAPQNVYTTNLVVGYNQSATTGATGCSALGTVDYNCLGATPRFNRLYPVIAGEDFLLMIKKFSGTGQEYTLLFGGGTAVLTNSLPPSVTTVSQVGCNPSQIKIDFSEDIQCLSLTPSGSEFTISNGSHTITSIAYSCTSGSNSFNTLTLTLQNPLPPGSYTLTVNNGTAPDNNTLLDVCGDPMIAGVPVSFTIPPQTPPTITQVTKANCAATILKVALSQPVQCSSISPNGSEFSITPGLPAITSVTTNCSGTNLSTDTIYINLQNPLAAGNYTLTASSVLASDGNTFIDNCGILMAVGTNRAFTISTTAAPTVTNPPAYCQGATATALQASGINLLWYTTATGGFGSSATPTVSTTTAGTFNFYVSQTISGCEGPRALITVTILSAPNPPTTSQDLYLFCVGAPLTPLSATGTNLLWYTTPTGGTGSTIAPTPNNTIPNVTAYYVTQTVGGCESARKEILVGVYATPAAPTVTSPVDICQGSTPTPLTATGTNLLWYTAATGGTGSATAPTPSTTTLGTTNYYVSHANNIPINCESPRAQITVNVVTTPAAPTVISPLNYCQNQTVPALTAGGSNLMWYTSATGGTGSSTAPTPPTNNIGTTIYYVGQSAGTCQGPRSPITVNVAATPAAPAVTPQVNYCVGNTAVALTAPGTNLKWYTVPTGGAFSTTAPTPSTSIAGTTSYYVTQSIGTCESPRAEITVVVTAIPAAPMVGPTVDYCQGETPQNFIVSGSNLLWYANATGGVGNPVAPTISTTSVSTTTYYVSQSSAGCEGSRSSITVNVNPTPAAPTLTVPAVQTYCQNSPTNLLSATGTILKWYTQANGGSSSATAPIISSAVAGSTIYYVSQTTGTCEGPRASITINITATPAKPAVSAIINYCPNEVVGMLSDSVTGTNLLWYANATAGVGSGISPIINTTIFPATYTFYVSQTSAAATGSCEGPRAQITVNVDNFLNVNIGLNDTICEGVSLKFFPIVTPSGALYQWRSLDEPNSTIDSVTILNATVKPFNDSRYVLQARIGGCIKEDTVQIKVLTKPAVSITSFPTAICISDSALLTGVITRITLPGIISSYKWTPLLGIRTDTTLQTYAYPTITTLYTLTATTTIADYGCDFTSTGTVKVIVQPIVKAFAGKDTIAVKGAAHQLQGSGASFYEWSSPTATVTNPSAKNPFTTLFNDAVFYLKGTDAIGCIGLDTVFVKVLNGPAYYVPNAFTPNGDGQNDIFRAIPVGFANTTYFRVFNRNGLLVFETNQYLKGWDGTYNGKPQPNGIYVWTVAGTDKDFKKVELKGTVNLLR